MSEDNINVTVEGGDGEFSEETRKYIAEKADETKRLAAETARLNQETARARAESSVAFHNNVQVQIGSWQQERDLAKQARREALECGNYDAADAAEERIRAADNAVSQWQYHAQANAPRVQPADPVESYASRLPARSAQWVREHPELVRDERAQAKLQAAHYDAMANGLQAESPEYFSHVQRFASGNGDDAMSPRARAQQAQSETGPKTVIRMTRAQYEHTKEMAEACGLDVKTYLARKQITDTAPEYRRMDDLGGIV